MNTSILNTILLSTALLMLSSNQVFCSNIKEQVIEERDQDHRTSSAAIEVDDDFNILLDSDDDLEYGTSSDEKIKQSGESKAVERIQKSTNTINVSDEEKIEKLQESIKRIDSKIEEDYSTLRSCYPGEQNVVITLGITGQGKSTLINFLAGKNLTAIKKSGVWKVDVDKPIAGIEVGHGVLSMTDVPHYWYDREERTVYYDCPGFGNTRSAEADIRDTYAIQKLFKTFKGAKILAVTSEPSIMESRSIVFQNFIGTLSNFFREDIDRLRKSLCLVITRQRDFDNVGEVGEYIQQNILSSLERGELSISSRENETLLRELSNFPLDHPRIAFFPMPSVAGCFLSLEDDGSGQQVRQNIIQALHHTSSETMTPTLAFSPLTQLYVQRIRNTVCDEIGNFISKELALGIDRYCSSKIREGNNPQELRTHFTHLEEMLKKTASSNFQVFANNLYALLYEYSLDSQSIKTRINIVEFLQGSCPDSISSIKSWIHSISYLKRQVGEFAQEPTVTIDVQGNLQIKGYLLGTSDINKAIELMPVNFVKRLVYIFASNTLYIDEDIISRGSFSKPGYSFSFSVPCWKVIGNRVIDLEGIDGEAGASGVELGAFGQPGRAGGNGGELFGQGRKFINLSPMTLDIRTRGGNGGKGGNGQTGADGANGVDGDFAKYVNFKNDLPSTKRPIWEEGYRYTGRGTDAAPGKDGGQGGQGGLGGCPGFAHIISDVGTVYESNPEMSHNGNDGIAGQGGQGGVHGRHCAGYKRELKWQGRKRTSIYTESVEIVNPHHATRTPDRAANGQTLLTLNTIGQETPSRHVSINRGDVIQKHSADEFHQHESTAKEENAFLDIPIELQAQIGTFLDQKSFINFSNTHPNFKAASQLIRDQKKIDLSGRKLTKEDCEILSQLPFSKFILSNCDLSNQGIQTISLCKSIIELDLSNNDVSENAFESLVSGNLSSLTILHLKSAMIKVKQFSFLKKNSLTSLTSLYLECNCINDEEVRVLASNNLPSLRSLYLSKNSIKDEGAKALASGNLSSLTKLYLTDNYISDTGAKALASGNLSSLTFLYLVDNKIENEGTQALVSGNLSSLRYLYLSMKPIRPYLNILKTLNPKISIIGVYGAGAIKD